MLLFCQELKDVFRDVLGEKSQAPASEGLRTDPLYRKRVLEGQGDMGRQAVGKSIFPYKGRIGGYWDAGNLRHVAGQLQQFGQLDAGGDAVEAFQGHDDFDEGGIAAAFAQAVDGTVNQGGATPDAGQGICQTQTEIIVGMDPQDHWMGRRCLTG